jgi:cell division septum initiation protein DivIVA
VPEQQPESAAGPEAGRADPTFEVVRRGFDQEQVLAHVRRGEERIHELEARLARAINELAEAREQLEKVSAAGKDPLEGVSQHVVDLVRGFDEEIERQRRVVELESTGMLAEARTEAARLRMDAQGVADQARGQADRTVREAREEAASVRAEVTALRETTLGRVRELRDGMRSSLEQLDAVLTDDEGEARVIVLGDASEGKVPPAPTVPPSS